MSSNPFSAGKSFWGVSLLVALGFWGCAGLGIIPNRSAEYSAALARATRGDQLYRGLETQLDIQAVYRSAAFRKTYMDEYARVYSLNPATKEKYLAAELSQAAQSDEFILVVNSTLSETNDLQKADSTWRIYLLRNGTQLGAASVERLRWKEEYMNRFYPLINPWSRIYRVRFVIPPEQAGAPSGPLSLEITGPPGKVRLDWEESSSSPAPAPVPAPALPPAPAPDPVTPPVQNEKAS